jgi:WD40 repeat protein/serine/threonine protein kinase
MARSVVIDCGVCGVTFEVSGVRPGDKTVCAVCNSKYVIGAGFLLPYLLAKDDEHPRRLKSVFPSAAPPKIDTGSPALSPRPEPTLRLIGERREDSIEDKVPLHDRRLGMIQRSPAKDNDYLLVDRIGQGGRGVVFRALQTSIDRNVAVKMIKPEHSENRGARDAFLREALITGSLDHPNIAAIHDLGRASDGSLFYAMKEVRGEPWHRSIKAKSEDENLDILMKVCDAAAYAHSKGVTHRDLKPENVMLGSFGEVFLMDWGLASHKFMRRGMEITEEPDGGASTEVEGTPAYMPPEMLAMPFDELRPCSDIYMLGGILYRIVTGLHPHAKDAPNFIELVKNNVIQPADKKGELVDIALKALSTNPEDRHASVKEFQRDIANYRSHAESLRLLAMAQKFQEKAHSSKNYNDCAQALSAFREALKLWPECAEAEDGVEASGRFYSGIAFEKGDFDLALSLLDPQNPFHEPIAAKISRAKDERDRRAARVRVLHAVVVSLTAAALVILAAAAVIISGERRKALEAKDRAVLAGQKAEAGEAKAKELLSKVERENYLSGVSLAKEKLLSGDTGEASAILGAAPEKLRGWEWGVLAPLTRPEKISLDGHSDSVVFAGFSPDGSKLISAGGGSLIIRRTGDYQALFLPETESKITGAALSPDGSLLAAALADGTVKIFKAANGEAVAVSDRQGPPPVSVSFSFDGAAVMAAAAGGSVRFLSPQGGKPMSGIQVCPEGLSHAVCSPAAPVMAVCRLNGSLELADFRGAVLKSFGGGPFCPVRAAFSPDGRKLAAAGGRSVRILDTVTGMDSLILSDTGFTVTGLAFSGDGKFLAAAGAGKAAVYSADNGSAVKFFTPADGAEICSVSFSPDGLTLAAGSASNKALLWDLSNVFRGRTICAGSDMAASADSASSAPLRGGSNAPGPAVVSPSGSGDIAVCRGSGLVMTGSALGKPRLLASADAPLSSAPAFSPDGRLVAAGAADGSVIVAPADGGGESFILRGHKAQVNSVCFSNNPDTLVSAGDDTEVLLWSLRTPQNPRALPGHSKFVERVLFSPDGRLAASCGWDGLVILRSPGKDKPDRIIDCGGPVSVLAFSPCSSKILAAGSGFQPGVWDISGGFKLASLGDPGLRVNSAVFTPDGKRVISSSENGSVKVWDAESGRETLNIPAKAAGLMSVSLSPDGCLLAAGCATGEVRVWSAAAVPSVEGAKKMLATPRPLLSADFTPAAGCRGSEN